MNKKQSLTLICTTIFLLSMMSISLLPTAMASGKSVYGTLYIDGQIAAPGIRISLQIDDTIIAETDTVTATMDGDNYVLGFNSTHEGNFAYFFVEGYDIDQSMYIGSKIGYILDLYATSPPASEEDEPSGGSPGGGGGEPFTSSGSEETNSDPIADGGGPYEGTTDAAIDFDGSASSDPDGDTLVYTWDFGDGSIGNGPLVSHLYTTADTFQVTLTVTDPDGASDENETTATIGIGNRAPINLIVTGNETGSKGELLSFSAVATDPEDESIKYVFDWDDGSPIEESAYIGSGVAYDTIHTYASFGVYSVSVYAEDTAGGSSAPETLEVSIDAIPISGEITGILGDEQGDGKYDVFISKDVTTGVETTKNGKIHIDSDADNDWDYVYDPVNQTLTKYAEAGDYDILPIIGLVGLIILAFLLFFFVYRRRGEKEEDRVPKSH